MIDNVTTNFSWQLPDASNPLSYDVSKIISSITAIDAAMAARSTTTAMNSAISTAIANLVASSPATLDTLNELAVALGDDPNFATTMTASLAAKLAKSGDTMTGLLTIAAAGLALQDGVDPDAAGQLTLVSGALRYMRGAAVREVLDSGTAQTATNKTFTAPVINGGALNGVDAGATMKDSTGANQALGYMGIPAKAAQTSAYQLVLDDAFFEVPTNSGITIPANAAVAFPIGTMISIRNTGSTGITIAITTDTLTQEGTTFTGTRTLAGNGIALLRKVGATNWLIMGSALT